MSNWRDLLLGNWFVDTSKGPRSPWPDTPGEPGTETPRATDDIYRRYEEDPAFRLAAWEHVYKTPWGRELAAWLLLQPGVWPDAATVQRTAGIPREEYDRVVASLAAGESVGAFAIVPWLVRAAALLKRGIISVGRAAWAGKSNLGKIVTVGLAGEAAYSALRGQTPEVVKFWRELRAIGGEISSVAQGTVRATGEVARAAGGIAHGVAWIAPLIPVAAAIAGGIYLATELRSRWRDAGGQNQVQQTGG